MKNVGIHVIYIKYYQILMIFPIFIAGSTGHNTKNES